MMRTFVRRLFVLLAAATIGGATSVTARGAITATLLYPMARPADYVGGGPFSVDTYGQVSAFAFKSDLRQHGVIWNSSGTFIDLHPAGYFVTQAITIDGPDQAGAGINTAVSQEYHALLWHGTNIATDIHPAGFTDSHVGEMRNGMKVGYGKKTNDGDRLHAILWDSANVATDLHPTSGYLTSNALDVNGTQQVGQARTTTNQDHAMLWNGTNAAIDLHPTSGFTSSNASAVGDGQQGGSGATTGGQTHALLWNGTNVAVDLHPTQFQFPVFTASRVTDVDDGWQVGWGDIPGTSHALLWHGTAASAIDLHASLGNGFLDSYAYAIEGDKVYGYAGMTSGGQYAVVWTVPEPSSCAAAVLAFGGLTMRRKRRVATAAAF